MLLGNDRKELTVSSVGSRMVLSAFGQRVLYVESARSPHPRFGTHVTALSYFSLRLSTR